MARRTDGGRRADWLGPRVFRSYRIPEGYDEWIKQRAERTHRAEGDVVVEALALLRETCGDADPDVSTSLLAAALEGLRSTVKQ